MQATNKSDATHVNKHDKIRLFIMIYIFGNLVRKKHKKLSTTKDNPLLTS